MAESSDSQIFSENNVTKENTMATYEGLETEVADTGGSPIEMNHDTEDPSEMKDRDTEKEGSKKQQSPGAAMAKSKEAKELENMKKEKSPHLNSGSGDKISPGKQTVHQRAPDPAKSKERDDRMRIAKERREAEQKKKLLELEEQARKKQELRQRQEEDRKKKILDMRKRDEEHRIAIEERKKKMLDEEKAKKEALMKKYAIRDNKLEQLRNRRSMGSYAFGSSTPRMNFEALNTSKRAVSQTCLSSRPSTALSDTSGSSINDGGMHAGRRATSSLSLVRRSTDKTNGLSSHNRINSAHPNLMGPPPVGVAKRLSQSTSHLTSSSPSHKRSVSARDPRMRRSMVAGSVANLDSKNLGRDGTKQAKSSYSDLTLSSDGSPIRRARPQSVGRLPNYASPTVSSKLLFGRRGRRDDTDEPNFVCYRIRSQSAPPVHKRAKSSEGSSSRRSRADVQATIDRLAVPKAKVTSPRDNSNRGGSVTPPKPVTGKVDIQNTVDRLSAPKSKPRGTSETPPKPPVSKSTPKSKSAVRTSAPTPPKPMVPRSLTKDVKPQKAAPTKKESAPVKGPIKAIHKPKADVSKRSEAERKSPLPSEAFVKKDRTTSRERTKTKDTVENKTKAPIKKGPSTPNRKTKSAGPKEKTAPSGQEKESGVEKPAPIKRKKDEAKSTIEKEKPVKEPAKEAVAAVNEKSEVPTELVKAERVEENKLDEEKAEPPVEEIKEESKEVVQEDAIVSEQPTTEEKTELPKEEEKPAVEDGLVVNAKAAEPTPTKKPEKSKPLTAEEEYKLKLAENRREAREKAQREAEEKRRQEEEARRIEEERKQKEEEEQRKFEEEQRRLGDIAREQEAVRLQQAIEENERRMAEEAARKEAEKIAKEEAEKKAKEEAERRQKEAEEKARKEEEERLERKKRLEMIMKRVKPGDDTSPKSETPSPAMSPSKGRSPSPPSVPEIEKKEEDLPSPVEDQKLEEASSSNITPEEAPQTAVTPVKQLTNEEGTPKFKSPLLQQMLGNKGRLRLSQEKLAEKTGESSSSSGENSAKTSPDKEDIHKEDEQKSVLTNEMVTVTTTKTVMQTNENGETVVTETTTENVMEGETLTTSTQENVLSSFNNDNSNQKDILLDSTVANNELSLEKAKDLTTADSINQNSGDLMGVVDNNTSDSSNLNSNTSQTINNSESGNLLDLNTGAYNVTEDTSTSSKAGNLTQDLDGHGGNSSGVSESESHGDLNGDVEMKENGHLSPDESEDRRLDQYIDLNQVDNQPLAPSSDKLMNIDNHDLINSNIENGSVPSQTPLIAFEENATNKTQSTDNAQVCSEPQSILSNQSNISQSFSKEEKLRGNIFSEVGTEPQIKGIESQIESVGENSVDSNNQKYFDELITSDSNPTFDDDGSLQDIAMVADGKTEVKEPLDLKKFSNKAEALKTDSHFPEIECIISPDNILTNKTPENVSDDENNVDNESNFKREEEDIAAHRISSTFTSHHEIDYNKQELNFSSEKGNQCEYVDKNEECEESEVQIDTDKKVELLSDDISIHGNVQKSLELPCLKTNIQRVEINDSNTHDLQPNQEELDLPKFSQEDSQHLRDSSQKDAISYLQQDFHLQLKRDEDLKEQNFQENEMMQAEQQYFGNERVLLTNQPKTEIEHDVVKEEKYIAHDQCNEKDDEPSKQQYGFQKSEEKEANQVYLQLDEQVTTNSINQEQYCHPSLHEPNASLQPQKDLSLYIQEEHDLQNDQLKLQKNFPKENIVPVTLEDQELPENLQNLVLESNNFEKDNRDLQQDCKVQNFIQKDEGSDGENELQQSAIIHTESKFSAPEHVNASHLISQQHHHKDLLETHFVESSSKIGDEDYTSDSSSTSESSQTRSPQPLVQSVSSSSSSSSGDEDEESDSLITKCPATHDMTFSSNTSNTENKPHGTKIIFSKENDENRDDHLETSTEEIDHLISEEKVAKQKNHSADNVILDEKVEMQDSYPEKNDSLILKEKVEMQESDPEELDNPMSKEKLDIQESHYEEHNNLMIEGIIEKQEGHPKQLDNLMSEENVEMQESNHAEHSNLMSEEKEDIQESNPEQLGNLMSEDKVDLQEIHPKEHCNLILEVEVQKQDSHPEQLENVMSEENEEMQESHPEEHDNLMSQEKVEMKDSHHEQLNNLMSEEKVHTEGSHPEEHDSLISEEIVEMQENYPGEHDNLMSEEKMERQESYPEEHDNLISEEKADIQNSYPEEHDNIISEQKIGMEESCYGENGNPMLHENSREQESPYSETEIVNYFDSIKEEKSISTDRKEDNILEEKPLDSQENTVNQPSGIEDIMQTYEKHKVPEPMGNETLDSAKQCRNEDEKMKNNLEEFRKEQEIYEYMQEAEPKQKEDLKHPIDDYSKSQANVIPTITVDVPPTDQMKEKQLKEDIESDTSEDSPIEFDTVNSKIPQEGNAISSFTKTVLDLSIDIEETADNQMMVKVIDITGDNCTDFDKKSETDDDSDSKSLSEVHANIAVVPERIECETNEFGKSERICTWKDTGIQSDLKIADDIIANCIKETLPETKTKDITKNQTEKGDICIEKSETHYSDNEQMETNNVLSGEPKITNKNKKTIEKSPTLKEEPGFSEENTFQKRRHTSPQVSSLECDDHEECFNPPRGFKTLNFEDSDEIVDATYGNTNGLSVSEKEEKQIEKHFDEQKSDCINSEILTLNDEVALSPKYSIAVEGTNGRKVEATLNEVATAIVHEVFDTVQMDKQLNLEQEEQTDEINLCTTTLKGLKYEGEDKQSMADEEKSNKHVYIDIQDYVAPDREAQALDMKSQNLEEYLDCDPEQYVTLDKDDIGSNKINMFSHHKFDDVDSKPDEDQDAVDSDGSYVDLSGAKDGMLQYCQQVISSSSAISSQQKICQQIDTVYEESIEEVKNAAKCDTVLLISPTDQTVLAGQDTDIPISAKPLEVDTYQCVPDINANGTEEATEKTNMEHPISADQIELFLPDVPQERIGSSGSSEAEEKEEVSRIKPNNSDDFNDAACRSYEIASKDISVEENNGFCYRTHRESTSSSSSEEESDTNSSMEYIPDAEDSRTENLNVMDKIPEHVDDSPKSEDMLCDLQMDEIPKLEKCDSSDEAINMIGHSKLEIYPEEKELSNMSVIQESNSSQIENEDKTDQDLQSRDDSESSTTISLKEDVNQNPSEEVTDTNSNTVDSDHIGTGANNILENSQKKIIIEREFNNSEKAESLERKPETPLLEKKLVECSLDVEIGSECLDTSESDECIEQEELEEQNLQLFTTVVRRKGTDTFMPDTADM